MTADISSPAGTSSKQQVKSKQSLDEYETDPAYTRIGEAPDPKAMEAKSREMGCEFDKVQLEGVKHIYRCRHYSYGQKNARCVYKLIFMWSSESGCYLVYAKGEHQFHVDDLSSTGDDEEVRSELSDELEDEKGEGAAMEEASEEGSEFLPDESEPDTGRDEDNDSWLALMSGKEDSPEVSQDATNPSPPSASPRAERRGRILRYEPSTGSRKKPKTKWTLAELMEGFVDSDEEKSKDYYRLEDLKPQMQQLADEFGLEFVAQG
jgi:hypothetical protein